MARVAAQPRALGGSVALSGLALVLIPHLCIALEPHGGLHNTARWAQSNVEAAAPRARQPLTRLRGGGLIDKRTPTYWPIRPEDEETIPADGSVGGHYTMEEVCANGGGEWIGRLPAGPDPARVRDRREAARMRPGLCGAAAEHEIVARRQCRCAFNSVGFEAPELIDVDACDGRRDVAIQLHHRGDHVYCRHVLLLYVLVRQAILGARDDVSPCSARHRREGLQQQARADLIKRCLFEIKHHARQIKPPAQHSNTHHTSANIPGSDTLQEFNVEGIIERFLSSIVGGCGRRRQRRLGRRARGQINACLAQARLYAGYKLRRDAAAITLCGQYT